MRFTPQTGLVVCQSNNAGQVENWPATFGKGYPTRADSFVPAIPPIPRLLIDVCGYIWRSRRLGPEEGQSGNDLGTEWRGPPAFPLTLTWMPRVIPHHSNLSRPNVRPLCKLDGTNENTITSGIRGHGAITNSTQRLFRPSKQCPELKALPAGLNCERGSQPLAQSVVIRVSAAKSDCLE